MAVVPNEASKPAMEFSLAMMSGIRISSQRTAFALRYRPLTYYQIPNIADADRPLYLHRLNSTYVTSFTPRFNFDWSGDARVGDVSYASLVRAFDDGTAASAVERLPLVFLATRSTFNYMTGDRNTISLGPSVSYRSVLNSLEDKDSAQIPETLNLGMTVADTVVVTRRDQLGVSVDATYSHVVTVAEERAGDAVFGTVQANWNHGHSPTSSSTLSGGMGANRSIDTGQMSLFPVVSVQNTSSFKWGGDAFSSSVAGGLRGFVDPVLATVEPQAFLALGLTGRHSSLFSTQAGLNGWTAVTKTPAEPPQYESSASINLAGIFDISTGVSVRTGVSWQLRAPHLAQLNALVVQSQPTAFVTLRGTLGTDRLQGSWL